MKIRSRAPLRVGLAGGGTDVSPFCDKYGGFVLNATINKYAYCTLIALSANAKTKIKLLDLNQEIDCDKNFFENIDIKDEFLLVKGVYHYFLSEFKVLYKPLLIETLVEAPLGSGLGSSSTLVVALVNAFAEMFNIGLGEYDLAMLSHKIERVVLNLAGGKQDQYAAAFGGFNFIEFYGNDKVIVNPLRIKSSYRYEMELRFLLYYTGKSRQSAKIIEQQKKVLDSNSNSLESMLELKRNATELKETILKGEISKIGEIMHKGWLAKKGTASVITNNHIDEVYEEVLKVGVLGGKVSGAGGGGFMTLFIEPSFKKNIIETLSKFGGTIESLQFTKEGALTWSI